MKTKIDSILRPVFMVGLMLAVYGCDSKEVTAPSGTMQSEPVADFDDGGETIEILTTHWINDADIGDGNGPVTDSLLRAPQGESVDRWIQFGGDYSNRRHSPIEALSPESVGRFFTSNCEFLSVAYFIQHT